MPEDDEYRSKIDNITVVVERIDKCLLGDYENPGLITKVQDNSKRSKDNTDKIEKRTAKDLALLSAVVVMLVGILVRLLK